MSGVNGLNRLSTGVRRLDELLEGGVPMGSATLVYGPSFVGKKILARNFLVSGMREGMPGIMVLTSQAADEVRGHLATIEPAYPAYETQGLAQFVDTYSKSIGIEEPKEPHTRFVDGPVNLNAISLALNEAEKNAMRLENTHRLVMDSASTLMAYTSAQTTFRFLQVLIGKARRAGATSMFLLEKGMHSEPEVQMIKHLMDGVIELKIEGAKPLLTVEGLGVTDARGWVEYRYTGTTMELTGSFAVGRIR